MKFYTGIGSRDCPSNKEQEIGYIASVLEKQGWTLRSGGADGADTYFENGVMGDNKEIFLPWSNFNGNKSSLFNPSDEAFEIAAKFHPNYKLLSDAGKRLMARNSHQVLGLKLNNPSSFLVCWTPGGKVVGGTSQAIRIASYYKVPIFNLGSETGFEEFKKFLKL